MNVFKIVNAKQNLRSQQFCQGLEYSQGSAGINTEKTH